MKRNRILWSGVLVLSCSLPVLSEEATPKKKWKDVAEFSLVTTNGNSNNTTVSGKNTFTYDWKKVGLEAFFGGLGTQSEGSTTAEQYFAGEKVSFKLTGKNYLFEKYRWDKDRFAGIRARHDISVGFGRWLLETKRNELMLELGGGYVSEERIRAPRNDFGSGRAYSMYKFVISETAHFSQDIEYLANFEDGDDYRLNTNTALTSILSSHLSLKVSYELKRVNDPPPGVGQTDTTTAVTLIVNY